MERCDLANGNANKNANLVRPHWNVEGVVEQQKAQSKHKRNPEETETVTEFGTTIELIQIIVIQIY